MRRRFQQVDVFSAEPFTGNPVAVVVDGEGVSTEEMQRVARWTNLSETTFLLPPTSPAADYRVRIFTLAHELPFAGHPTLGSCHAWLEAGGEPRREDMVVQECGAGDIAIRRGGGMLAFAAPPPVREGPVDADLAGRLGQWLGVSSESIVDVHWVDNGPGWIGVLLGSAEEVLRLEPGFPKGAQLDVGVAGPYPDGAECAFEVRAFFNDEHGQMREDPVTGSLNASLAQWLIGMGRVTAPFVTSQGTRLGRRGRPHIDQSADGQVWVGGATRTLVNGDIDL